MITKQELLSSISDEMKIVKHLVSKVKPEHLSYRPSEKQRTMLELIQYLSYCGLVSTNFVLSGTWDSAKKLSEDSKQVNLGNFAGAMDTQMKNIEILLKEFDDKALESRDSKTPWGTPIKAGLGILNTTLKFMSCYRMQLFLYLKSVGLSELNYSNCWIGSDPVPK